MKQYSYEQWEKFGTANPEVLPFVAVSAGISDHEFALVSKILEKFPEIKLICLDVANGYQEAFALTVTKYRNNFPNHVIIAGNVCTPDMTVHLLHAGADIIKIGIGPGSVCTTRL
jgi:GMP reductase